MHNHEGSPGKWGQETYVSVTGIFSFWTVEWVVLKLPGELHVCSLLCLKQELHVSILSWQVSSLGLYTQVRRDEGVDNRHCEDVCHCFLVLPASQPRY